MGAYIKLDRKQRARFRRKTLIRSRLSGTSERPRVSVFRSLKHIYAQAVDDTSNQVLVATSDLSEALRGQLTGKNKKDRAKAVGQELGRLLLEKKVDKVVFDRNGYIYHGRVRAVADGARAAGLKF